MKSEYDNEIKEYLKRKVSVTIIKSDETGEGRWAISVDENPEFWMNSYTKKGDAIRYCQKYELPYKVEKL